MWNAVDAATYGLQVAIAVAHLSRSPAAAPLLPPLCAAQAVLLFSRLNYFSRLFADRFSFLDSLKQVCGDAGTGRRGACRRRRERQTQPFRLTTQHAATAHCNQPTHTHTHIHTQIII